MQSMSLPICVGVWGVGCGVWGVGGMGLCCVVLKSELRFRMLFCGWIFFSASNKKSFETEITSIVVFVCIHILMFVPLVLRVVNE